MKAPVPEVTGQVSLCDARGLLDPEAIGWGRHPYWDCNLRGRPLRKKRWDYWCFVGPERLLSVCFAHIDYAGLASAYILDYGTGVMAECTVAMPFARQPRMPSGTTGAVSYERGRTRMTQDLGDRGGVIAVSAPECGGRPLEAEIRISLPPEQETLNVVVPWAADTFQFTSKQLPLRIEGGLRWGGEEWRFEPDSAFGVRDFGRGIWPYRTSWNWAALSGHAGAERYGVNLGGQWTDGTGATENGLLLGGVLHWIPDTVHFECDPSDYMKPWRIHTPGADIVDLRFTPFFERRSRLNLGVLSTRVHQCFGRFQGAVRAGGHTLPIDNALGWAEEHHARW